MSETTSVRERHSGATWTVNTLNGVTWQPWCLCDWRGPVRREQLGETVQQAVEDATDHVQAAVSRG